MMDYDDSNIFAKILKGEIPSHRIYENDEVLAFMDVMPQTDGHCLVIPKNPSTGLLDADPATLATLMLAVQKIAPAAVKAMNADGFQLRQYNGAAAGQTVHHLHFHILPVRVGHLPKPHAAVTTDHAMLARQAELIRAALK